MYGKLYSFTCSNELITEYVEDGTQLPFPQIYGDMSANAYGNSWKSMERVLKHCSTSAYIMKHQISVINSLKGLRKAKEFEKDDEVLGDIMKY